MLATLLYLYLAYKIIFFLKWILIDKKKDLLKHEALLVKARRYRQKRDNLVSKMRQDLVNKYKLSDKRKDEILLYKDVSALREAIEKKEVTSLELVLTYIT